MLSFNKKKICDIIDQRFALKLKLILIYFYDVCSVDLYSDNSIKIVKQKHSTHHGIIVNIEFSIWMNQN